MDEAATTSTAGRLQPIQALRGIAATLVVWHHALNMVDEQAGAGSSRLSATLRGNDFGASGVDLFFVISGFVMSATLVQARGRRGAGSFLKRRFLRVLPLFWLMSCLFVDLKHSVGQAPTFAAVANTIFILPIFDSGRYDEPILAVGWTLAFEFVLYAIVAVAMCLTPSKRTACVLGALSLLPIIGLSVRPDNNALAVLTNPILFEFLLGAGCYWLASRRIGPGWTVGAFIAGGVGLVLSAAFASGPDMDPWPLIYGESSLARLCIWGVPWALVLFGCLGLPNQRTAVSRLGDASYSIYLTHPITLAMISIQWNRFYTVPADAVLIASVPLALGLGILTFRVIEQPLARLLPAALRASNAGHETRQELSGG